MLGNSITTAVVTLSDNVKIVSLPPWILFRLESVFGMDWIIVESTPKLSTLYIYKLFVISHYLILKRRRNIEIKDKGQEVNGTS